jgi:hypothetical protein
VTFPAATRKDHLRFCEIENWEKVRSSKGGSGTHHDTFELALANGDISRTRISGPPDRTDYGPSLWNHILKDQLKVTEQEFWECLKNKVLPKRGMAPEPSAEPLPTEVVWALINRVGLSEAEVGKMPKQEAVDRLNTFWTTGE